MSDFTMTITTHPNRDHADGPDTVAKMVDNQGQDWAEWAEKGLVAAVTPMSYTNSLLMLKKRTTTHLAHLKGNCEDWEGIGKNSSRSSLSTLAFIEQIEAVRSQGAEGVMIFPYSFD